LQVVVRDGDYAADTLDAFDDDCRDRAAVLDRGGWGGSVVLRDKIPKP